jgi:hypothetical protein
MKDLTNYDKIQAGTTEFLKDAVFFYTGMT